MRLAIKSSTSASYSSICWEETHSISRRDHPMIAVPASQLTIGYWNCRALGAPLRMMAAFRQLDYRDKHYEVSRAQCSPAAIDEIAFGVNLQIQRVSACMRTYVRGKCACMRAQLSSKHIGGLLPSSPKRLLHIKIPAATSAVILQVPN